MDIPNRFKSYSVPLPLPPPPASVEQSSSSEVGTGQRAVHSDEEVVLLATSRPKKRAGRRIFKETRHPIYRGVRKRNKDKWVCELREPNKKTRIWLGTYPTPEMAARAHDVAALAFRGKSACLNFADSAWRLPVPASKNSADIRRAAAEAASAEAFRPRPQPQPQELDEQHSATYARQESVKSSEPEVSSSCLGNNQIIVPEKVQFEDEEAMLNMPNLLASMAEGLLLSPPRNCDEGADDSDIDVSLWSYSI